MNNSLEEEEYQSFRIGKDGQIIKIVAQTDGETGQRVVYWEDIEFQFPGIHCVRYEDIGISFARDSKKRRIEPWCIRCHPGVVLEVVLKNPTQQLFDPRPLTPMPGQSPSASVSSLSIHSPSMLSPLSPSTATTTKETLAGAVTGQQAMPSASIPSIPLNPPALAPRPVWVPIEEITIISGSAVDFLPGPHKEGSQDQCMVSFADLSTNFVSTTPVENSAQEVHGGSEDGPVKHHHQQLQPEQQHLLQAIQTDSSHHAATIHQAIQDSLHTIQQNLYRNEALQREVLDRQETAAEVQERILRIQEQSLDRLAMIQSQVRAVLTQTYELHEYPIPRLFIVLPVAAEQRRRDRLWRPFSESFKLYFLCECGDHTRGEEYANGSAGDGYDKYDAGVDSWEAPVQRFHSQKHKQLQRHQQPLSEPSSISTNSGSSFQPSISSISFSSSSTSSSSASTSGSSQQSSNSHNRHDYGVTHPWMTQSHHIHLAKHEGYDLERPTEFFRKYGPHILTLLQMLKYGVMAAEIVVPPLAHWKMTDGIERVQNGLNFATNQLEPKVDAAIQYLEALATVGFDGTRLDSDTEGIVDRAIVQNQTGERWQHQKETQAHALEALEGADLRHLSTFLLNKDESKVLGNLYRIVTAQGHVKWVCLDHFRSTYRESWTRPFRDLVLNQNRGQFDEVRGFVRVRLLSSTVARQFYEALERARFIHELELALDWETTLEDLRMLRDALQKTNVLSLRLDLCQSQGPTRDILNRNRRFDPIMQIMANTRVQSLILERCDYFWNRLSKSTIAASSIPSVPLPLTVAESPTAMSPGSPGPLIPGLPGSIQLRSLFIQGSILSDSWKQDQVKMEDLIRRCQRLTELGLQCVDVDTTFDLVHRATTGFRQIRLEALYLTVNESVSTSSSAFSSPLSPSTAQASSSASRPKYEHQQEQVDIVIRQPQAEISSVIISSNKRPYTDLVYSGQLQKLTLCHDIDLASQETQLRSIIHKNRRSLVEFGAQCRVEELSRVFEIIQESVEPCVICSSTRRNHHNHQSLYGQKQGTEEGEDEMKKNHGQHHRQFPYLHVELKDTGGRNSIVSTRVQDPRATILELTGADSLGREAIFQSLGWAVKKIPPGLKFSKEILKALEQGILTAKNPLRTLAPGDTGELLDGVTTRLQSLHANITSLDEKGLDLLAKVIELAAPTLEKLDIVVLREHQQLPQATSTVTGKTKDAASVQAASATVFVGSQNALIAQFILRVSAQITRLQISAFGLSGLMMDLSAATTQRIAAATTAAAAAVAPLSGGGGGEGDRLNIGGAWISPAGPEDSYEKFITFAVGAKDQDPMGKIVPSTLGLGRSPSVSFPLNPPQRSPSCIPRSGTQAVRSGSSPSTTSNVIRSSSSRSTVTGRRSSSDPSFDSNPSSMASPSAFVERTAVISMSRLRELVIENKADPSPLSLSGKSSNPSSSITMHCPMQESYLQWLLIPLSSPRLESVRLGHLDFMKDAWSAILWTLFEPRRQQQQQRPPSIESTSKTGSAIYHRLQKLVLEGTNLSDGQVKEMLEGLDNLVLLVSSSSMQGKKEEVGDETETNTQTAPGLALKEIKIEGSLVTRPVLTALETRVKILAPSCRVVLS